MSATDTPVELQVFADYFQFTLQDEDSSSEPPDDWGAAITPPRLIATAPGVVGIGTARNMRVPVTVEVRETPPSSDLTGFDHVTQASLEIPSGTVVILGNEYRPRAPRVAVKPGTHRVRVHYTGLNTISDDGLDGNDHYTVVLWPGTATEATILKQYAGQFPGG